MPRKCEQSLQGYPGLKFHSAVEPPNGKAADCTVGTTPMAQYVSVTNASLLRYKVSFTSRCDATHLHYPEAPEDIPDNTWIDSFSVPFRWDTGARKSSTDTKIAARSTSPSASDRDIEIELSCIATGYAAVGPFVLTLQVDAQG
jgi:hypothetical protein